MYTKKMFVLLFSSALATGACDRLKKSDSQNQPAPSNQTNQNSNSDKSNQKDTPTSPSEVTPQNTEAASSNQRQEQTIPGSPTKTETQTTRTETQTTSPNVSSQPSPDNVSVETQSQTTPPKGMPVDFSDDLRAANEIFSTSEDQIRHASSAYQAIDVKSKATRKLIQIYIKMMAKKGNKVNLVDFSNTNQGFDQRTANNDNVLASISENEKSSFETLSVWYLTRQSNLMSQYEDFSSKLSEDVLSEDRYLAIIYYRNKATLAALAALIDSESASTAASTEKSRVDSENSSELSFPRLWMRCAHGKLNVALILLDNLNRQAAGDIRQSVSRSYNESLSAPQAVELYSTNEARAWQALVMAFAQNQ